MILRLFGRLPMLDAEVSSIRSNCLRVSEGKEDEGEAGGLSYNDAEAIGGVATMARIPGWHLMKKKKVERTEKRVKSHLVIK